MASLILLMVTQQSSARPHRRISSSVCMVADIRMHNSKTAWWWHVLASTPIIASRKPRGAGFESNEWMVFMSDLQYHTQKSSVIEVAHRIDANSCRFLLHSQSGWNTMRFTAAMPCKAGQNGESGPFSTSFDSLTYRRQ